MSADLAFAETLLSDLRRAWVAFGADVESRLRFANVLFPGGLPVSKSGEIEPVETNPIIEAAVSVRVSSPGTPARTRRTIGGHTQTPSVRRRTASVISW